MATLPDRPPRLLVTGARGYIGRRFTRMVLDRGVAVETYDSVDGQDVLDSSMLRAAVGGVDVVVNLAAIGDIYEAEADPDRAFEVNVIGAERVGEACLDAGRRLVHASTCCVYGSGNGGPIDEGTVPAPTEVYARQKFEAERRLLFLAGRGLRLVIARLATTYGEDMRPGSVFHRLIQSTVRKEPFPVHGDGSQTRAYTHIDDLCLGLLALAGGSPREVVYNVAGDDEVSVEDLLRLGERVFETSIPRISRPQRAGQIFRQRLRADRLRNEFGWVPTVKLEEGVRRMYRAASDLAETEAWHMEIPCLHRVHTSRLDPGLDPAHWIQWRMGLSVSAAELAVRLTHLQATLEACDNPATKCLVTFDDGYRDVLALRGAFRKSDRLQPVLFVPTSITDGEPNWFDSYYALLGELPETKLLKLWTRRGDQAATNNGLSREGLLFSLATGPLKKRLRSMTYVDVTAELRDLAGWVGFDVPRCDGLYLSEQDLRSLAREGWTVASHGHHHQNLTLLQPDSLHADLRESLGRVLDLGGRAWLGYPDGKWNPAVLSMARDVRYTKTFVLRSEPGANETDLIPRVLWEPGIVVSEAHMTGLSGLAG